MLASSSRVAVRTLRMGQASSFSTSPVCMKKTLIVELLKDVPGLGTKFDRVKVSKALMRHQLAPTRLARWVPWKRAADRPVLFRSSGERSLPSNQLLLDEPGFGEHAAAQAEGPEPTPTDLLNKLHVLPDVLTFERRTVSHSTPALHGSLTLSDVQELLLADYGLDGKDVDVEWVGEDSAARRKELGTWDATVTIRGYGQEQVDMAVEVIRKK